MGAVRGGGRVSVSEGVGVGTGDWCSLKSCAWCGGVAGCVAVTRGVDFVFGGRG